MDAKLNQSDLIALLAKGSNISMAKAELFTKNFFELIIEGLEQDGIVKINGLGTFKVTEVASRGSVNVNTGEKIEIKGHKKLVFIPADALKDSVNQPFAMFEPVEVDEAYQPDATAADVENDEAVDEIVEETSAPMAIEEPVVEEKPVETPLVEEEIAVEKSSVAAESEIEASTEEETVLEPENTSDGEGTAVEAEEPECVAEPKIEETAVAETVAVQEKPAEPVMVRVPGKKKSAEKPVAKKKRPIWLYSIVAVVVIAAAYFGYTAMSDGKASKDNTVANEGTVSATVTDTPQEVVAVVDTNPNIDVVTENMDILETTDVSVSSDSIAAATVDAKSEPAETAVENATANDEVADEIYVFTVVEELASTKLKDISPADTTLYVAKGDYCLHTVAPDETLTKIARKYYGDKKLWPYIVKYNDMDKPDALSNGMEIRIPMLVPKK